ncbi:hypothetical protein [Neisseria maigaei]|nr:hypothetical protein [Neisseria maigaei]
MPSETDSDGILALTPVRAGKPYRLILRNALSVLFQPFKSLILG